MSYRHTLEATLESLQEIEALVHRFPGNGNIPAIEIDLALQKLRNVYELMLMFKKPHEEPDFSVESREKASKVSPKKVEEPVASAIHVADRTEHQPKKVKGEKEAQILSDQFKGGTTLYETLHQSLNKEEETLGHAKQVTNLLEAIGINDRYNFVRELFNNDTSIFEKTINLLNDAMSFNDAYNYISRNFDWDMDSEEVKHLLEIIRRKYIKGRYE